MKEIGFAEGSENTKSDQKEIISKGLEIMETGTSGTEIDSGFFS